MPLLMIDVTAMASLLTYSMPVLEMAIRLKKHLQKLITNLVKKKKEQYADIKDDSCDFEKSIYWWQNYENY